MVPGNPPDFAFTKQRLISHLETVIEVLENFDPTELKELLAEQHLHSAIAAVIDTTEPFLYARRRLIALREQEAKRAAAPTRFRTSSEVHALASLRKFLKALPTEERAALIDSIQELEEPAPVDDGDSNQ